MRQSHWTKVIVALSAAFFMMSTGCTPQSGKVTPIQTPARAVQSPIPPTVAPQPVQKDNGSVTEGCPAGSEAAIPELRNCCRERNWGKACDGGCWAAGVGEKLTRMCNGTKTSTSDCAQSPAKSKTTEWCAFHYNRRYCGISDSEWISHCKNGSSGVTNPGGNDCGKSPTKSLTRDWCNFHYNRRYCGISDAEWVQTCTPVQSSTAASLTTEAASSPTPSSSPTATSPTPHCKTTQNRSLPYPPCPQRTSAKTCEEGTNGKEEGQYCVWTGP